MRISVHTVIFFLYPLQEQSTYIKDMIDCINKIESHENLPDIQSIKYDVNSIQTWNLTRILHSTFKCQRSPFSAQMCIT